MKIGVDYYPEHWDESLWEQDVALMQETGVKLVRLAEFAWARLEPKEGEYDFAWLDRAVELFALHGIEVVLCTPTNCPPLWFYEKYPDAVQVGADGNRISIGIRGHRCYRNPHLRERTVLLLDRMVSRYKDHPHVTAWQIDNELEANFCRCPLCADGFRQYLREKFGTVEAVNAAFGNHVWSGSYSDWQEVRPPMGTHPQAWYNPALMLEYHRFAAKDAAEYVQFQLACIRKHCPEIPVTTNTWFCENHVDFHDLFQQLDFVSYDNYPTTRIPDDPENIYSHAFHLDLMRGIKRQNFWIMEQLSGGLGSWMPMSRTTSPGMIRGYALQAFAHGADTIVHFRWRTAVTGAEMHWHGLIDHSGVPGRRFAEFCELCRIADTLADVSGSEIPAQIAILYSHDNACALKIQPQTEGFHYLQQLKFWHDACVHCGVNADVIGQHENLSQYRIIIAPAMYVTDPEVTAKLKAFAENGGTVILGTRSGVKDANNNCIMQPLPTVYTEMTGCIAEEYDPIGWEQEEISLFGENFRVTQWCDILQETTAEGIGRYTTNFYKGKAGICRNVYGNGVVYYFGTVGERRLYHRMMEEILTESGITYTTELPAGVERTIRTSGDMQHIFLFNNTDRVQELSISGKHYRMQPFDMVIETKTED